MKTLHKRCAGLDVHKTEVVACLPPDLPANDNAAIVPFTATGNRRLIRGSISPFPVVTFF